MKKNHWHYIFVEEPIGEVIDILEKQALEISYDKKGEKFEGISMGYFEGNSGLIQVSSIWHQKERNQILEKTGRNPQTCLVLLEPSDDFFRIVRSVEKYLTIINLNDQEVYDYPRRCQK
jgi:hypothetical protein